MVVKQVETLIAEGQLAPGAQLPPERELARMLSVSRTSVRQAISAMESLGMLESKQGEGTFVTVKEEEEDILGRLSPKHLVDQQLTPDEILETRIILECPIVRICTENATEQEILNIKSHLERNRLRLGDKASIADMKS